MIVQQFRNLNAYDQLDVDVDIRGALPVFPSGATINYLDGDLEFVRVSRGRITSRSQQLALVNDESIVIDVEQEVRIFITIATSSRNQLIISMLLLF